MWKVYKTISIDDSKYGKRSVEIVECEGSCEYCQEYVSFHPGTYVAWVSY